LTTRKRYVSISESGIHLVKRILGDIVKFVCIFLALLLCICFSLWWNV